MLRHNEDAEKVPSAEKLVDCYKNSDLCKNVRNELNEINEKEKGDLRKHHYKTKLTILSKVIHVENRPFY